METILIGIFIIGYLAITLEHTLKVDKLIPALAMMAFLWASISLFNLPVFEVNAELKELHEKINLKTQELHTIGNENFRDLSDGIEANNKDIAINGAAVEYLDAKINELKAANDNPLLN